MQGPAQGNASPSVSCCLIQCGKYLTIIADDALQGSFEAPQHSVLKLEHRKRSQQMILSWTHPSNRHLGCPDEFTIVLSPFVCCGYAKVGDIQAPDLTPKGLPEHFAKVEVEHGFWVHAPERQRTFYFYAKTREEQKEWVNLIRHNLEVFRSHPDASAKILRRCQKTLAEHGYNDKEQARKLNAVKHALRDRRFRQFDRKSDNDEDKIGWATFQGKTDKVAALLIPDDKDEKFDLWAEKAAGEWDVNQCFSADLGGNSLLIEAVKRDATGILLMLLDRKANVDVQNVDGDTALIVASRLGREFAAIHLLHAGADLKVCMHAFRFSIDYSFCPMTRLWDRLKTDTTKMSKRRPLPRFRQSWRNRERTLIS